MSANEYLINTFYLALQNKDYESMQKCYSDNAVFSDEVFLDLNANQVRAMWEMLIKKGRDLQVEFKNIRADDNKGSADWIATYTFSKTKRKVVNHIKAKFIFEDGKILKHTDSFNFYSWAKQALGITGFLFGWANLIKAKVQKSAMESLSVFMKKTPGKI